MLVGIHLMLPENGMEAKGHFGKKHSPVDAGIQKCAIQCVLWHGAKSMKMIGSGTCNRLSPQTHDEERDEEGPRYSLEPSQTLDSERFYRFPMPS